MKRSNPAARSARPIRTFAAGLVARQLIKLLILLPVLAAADVIIELTDGRRIVVPVDREDVQRISFQAPDSGSAQTTENVTGVAVGVAQSAVPDGRRIWRVGQGHELKFPSDAARVAGDGDIVEIEAGVYPNDYAVWRQNGITIRGVNGMAHLKSRGLIPNGKAIWILKGNDMLIENVEYSGAAVRDTNGAGIRHEGGNLTLRNTFFHNNEFSILTGRRPNANIEVLSSRFWFQQREKRHSHGIYIGAVRRFSLVGSHFKGTDRGHQVKSRALENHILYNRIEDVPGGNSSRLIDLSNCGLSFIIGNDLHQGRNPENLNAIAYGPEDCPQRTAAQMKLFVINNTFVNEARNGSLVRNMADGKVLVANNLYLGKGVLLVGDGVESNNVQLPLRQRQPDSWAAPPGSAAIDGAVQLKEEEGVSLIPSREFNPPAGTRERPRDAVLDVGAREYEKRGT